MANVYFTNINNLQSDSVFQYLLDKADANTKKKIQRYSSRHEQLTGLCGRYLLNKLLCSYKFDDRFSVKDLEYNNWGKPYFGNQHYFDFSISHSGNVIVCAGSKYAAKIGVDTEKKEFRDIEAMREYFTDKEWHAIQTAEDSDEVFYKMWVRKEACIKAIGKGLFLPLHEIDVCEDEVILDGVTLRLYNLYLMKGYATCIATDEFDSVGIREVDMNKLITDKRTT